MSKIGVQASEVWAAADQVLIGGQRPTIERVRQTLGRGSPNTVGPQLDAWYQQLGQRLQAQLATATEAGGVPSSLQTLLIQLWESAQQEAKQAQTQKNQHIDAELQAQREALELEAQETLKQQQQLQQREADLNAHIALLQAQLKLADQRLDESLRSLADKEVQLEASRRNNAQTSQKKQVLEAELLRLRDEHEAALRQLTTEHHGQLTRWMAEVDRARQEKKQAEAEFAQTQAGLRQAMERQTVLHQQTLQAQQEQLAAVREKGERHELQWREAVEQNQRVEQERALLQQRFEALNRQQTDFQQLNAAFLLNVSRSLAAHEPEQGRASQQTAALKPRDRQD